ncbi:SpoIID/LytB domain-containing protein [Peptoniphilus sp. GNH]|nr:SpoIID/LytB domain protein [Clostridiales bacterium KA00134]UHR03127.1 SpoIID/LytB domain-containing protein [Peptoniphilus sp. GNH]
MKKILYIILLILIILPNTARAEEDYLNIKIQKSLAEGEEVRISSKSILKIYDEDGNVISSLNTNTIKAKLTDGKINLENPLGKIICEDFSSDGRELIGSSSFIRLAKTEYRGGISFRINNGKLDTINRVMLEDYLKGVVPREMSPSSPIEALKAQAICARSFALANRNKFIKNGYNLCDTTTSQVYGGVSSEKKRSSKAVDDTNGVCIYYNDKVASAIFGASSGGYVASAEEVWGGKNLSYLQSFEDEYSNDPWSLRFSFDELRSKLSDLNLSDNFDLYINSRDSSGRVKEIKSDNGSTISGNKLRSILGNTKFKSTLFEIEREANGFRFKGNGYGHGVGMSQRGAINMAKKSLSHKDILNYYFRGIEIR